MLVTGSYKIENINNWKGVPHSCTLTHTLPLTTTFSQLLCLRLRYIFRGRNQATYIPFDLSLARSTKIFIVHSSFWLKFYSLVYRFAVLLSPKGPIRCLKGHHLDIAIDYRSGNTFWDTMVLSFVTLNVNGLKAKTKRRAIFKSC